VITREEAVRLATAFVERNSPPGPLVLLDTSATAERPYGWLFRYDTATALKTGDPDESLLGCGPLLVRREDGRIVRFSSAYSTDAALRAYERDPARFSHIDPYA
jgi:hypothetical protein